MDVVIIIVALLLVGGVAAAMHGFIKPAADWLYPPQANVPEPKPAEDPGIQSRPAQERREARARTTQRKLEQREEKALQRELDRMDRQHAAEDARWERERARFWREIERIERNAKHRH